jgi:AraC family transcriptional regulator of adaptative response / DNA-3-methyladenine glycosylase II
VEFDVCYRALGARDGRFDGWFFTAVTSTGVYCRPSCPAMTPKREHVRFFPSAAACQQAGFRACKRCRPDATPGSPEWNSRGDVVARAMRLIADGEVDRRGVPGLAAALGYSVRQLQRVVAAELGAGPLALARAQRAQTARTLIETSTLPMTEVAFAAGFESIRQFNATVRAVFAMTPTELRRRAGRSGGVGVGVGVGVGAGAGAASAGLRLKLSFRRPLRPDNLFGHLAATAIPGVEEVTGRTYRRTLGLPFGAGIVELTPESDHVACRLFLVDLRDLSAAIARSRWLLDLDADPSAIDGLLSEDQALRELIARAPGRRVPRTVDGAEMAIRAVLGQQISTAAARTHGARLAARHGEPVSDPGGGGLSHVFPLPAALSEARFAMPAGRQATMRALLAALRTGELDLSPGGARDLARAALDALPGIGPWTTEVIAMRALGDPDAFPATDLGVRRGAEALGLPGARSALIARAERWRPWRAYAVQHLWGATRHPINDWPPVAVARVEPAPDRIAA